MAGNMGVIPPAPGFLDGLREITTQAGALLIFDEVVTGFRAGYGGAQGAFGITPDLTCLGKIVGGGLPLAAYGGRREIMEMLAPLGPALPGWHALGQSGRDGGRPGDARSAGRDQPVRRARAAGDACWPMACRTLPRRPACRCRCRGPARR